ALRVRSVTKLYALDPGIETKGIAVVDVMGSPNIRNTARGRTIDELMAALAALPGVRSVGAAMKIPLRGGGDSFDVTIAGHPDADRTFTYFRIVTRDYFATLGIKLRAGRTFGNLDRPLTRADSNATLAIVVNEAFVQKYFPGENPIGRITGGGFDAPQRIIGIVSNVAEANLTDAPEPVRYYLGGQAPWFGNEASFVFRATRPGDAPALLEAGRR